jgi:hyperosmotically inducible periplasmic protein
MDSQTIRKIIVAGGMAAVVGIGVVIFALRSHSAASVAQTTPAVTPPVAQIPPTAPEAAPMPAAPPAVQVPDAPAAVAQSDSGSSKADDATTAAAVEPKLARKRHVAKADTSDSTLARSGSAADMSKDVPAETVANRVDPVKSADEVPPPPAISGSSADSRDAGTGADLAAADSQITTDVKSQIAGDTLTKDVNIGVTTTRGVVALSGSLASQDAIDHVKDVVGKVKDVKSVDSSALVLASL